jgi:uncharacterized protein
MLMRVLLVVVLVAVLLWWLGARSRSRTAGDSRKLNEPQAFARCARCGVHLPLSDAVLDRGIAYCSEAHRLAGPKDRGAS